MGSVVGAIAIPRSRRLFFRVVIGVWCAASPLCADPSACQGLLDAYGDVAEAERGDIVSILGDWLLDNGATPAEQRYGALLLHSRALARLPAGDPREPELRAAEKALQEQVASDLARMGLTDVQFLGGRLYAVASASALDHYGDQLAASPYLIHGIRLSGMSGGAVPAYVARYAPFFRRLDALDLRGIPDGRRALEGVLAIAPAHLPRLRELGLQRLGLGREGLGELLASPLLARLRGLDIADNGLDADAVALLVASPAVRGLRSLNLCGNDFGPRGATAIAQSPHLGGLRNLLVGWCGLGLGAERLLERARQTTLRGLEDLFLGV